MPNDTSPGSTGSTGLIPLTPWGMPRETLSYVDEVALVSPELWTKYVETLRNLPDVRLDMAFVDSDGYWKRRISDAIIDAAIDSVFGPRPHALENTTSTEL
jgi:hypothetical protein